MEASNPTARFQPLIRFSRFCRQGTRRQTPSCYRRSEPARLPFIPSLSSVISMATKSATNRTSGQEHSRQPRTLVQRSDAYVSGGGNHCFCVRFGSQFCPSNAATDTYDFAEVCLTGYCLLAARLLEQLHAARVPVHEDTKECLHHNFPGKHDRPSGTAIHPSDVEPGRPDEEMKFLATECGADDLLAGFHDLMRGLGLQQPTEDAFQLSHVLDWCRRGARWKIREFNLATNRLHLASGVAC